MHRCCTYGTMSGAGDFFVYQYFVPTAQSTLVKFSVINQENPLILLIKVQTEV